MSEFAGPSLKWQHPTDQMAALNQSGSMVLSIRQQHPFIRQSHPFDLVVVFNIPLIKQHSPVDQATMFHESRWQNSINK